MHATQRDAHIFATQRPRDRFAQGGLAHARRAVEAQDGGLHVALEFQHRQVLDDAVFDFLQSVVVLVQHFLGVGQVQVVFGQLAPGQIQHEFDVVVLDAVVRRGRVVFLQLGHLLFEDARHVGRPFLFGRARAELGEIFHLVHAQLFLDGLQLVVQVVFALLLVYLALNLGVDLIFDAQQLVLRLQQFQQVHRPGLDGGLGQQVGLPLEMLHLHGRGDEVHQEGEIVDSFQGRHRLFGGEGGRFDNLHRPLFQGVGNGPDIGVVLFRQFVGQVIDIGFDIRVEGNDILDFQPFDTLKDGGYTAIRHIQRAENLGNRSVRAEVTLARVLHRDIALGYGTQETAFFGDILDDAQRNLAAHGHGIDDARKQHGVPQGQYREFLGQEGILDFGNLFTLDDGNNANFIHNLSNPLV